MSCEGNRLKFFDQVQTALGLDAKSLERIYQAGKAKGVQPDEHERVTQKTRLLFADIQEVGLKPPTHSADGLPKMESRAGYAAVFDYVRQNAPPRFFELMEEYKYKTQEWPLAISPTSLLNSENINGKGYFGHRYHDLNGLVSRVHVWGGYHPASSTSRKFETLTGAFNIFNDPTEKPKMTRFMRADANGLLPDGYPPEGFDSQGFDSLGYSLYGLTRAEMQDPQTVSDAAVKEVEIKGTARSRRGKNIVVDVEGFKEDGFRPINNDDLDQDVDRFGFNRLGFKGGRSWTGYDEKGLDAQGKPAPQVKGYDAWGYNRKDGLTAPDAAGRRYNLIGWVYDPATDECYDPLNPTRRMKHSDSWWYSVKAGKVVLKRSYIPTKGEMEARIRNPSIRWDEYRNGGAPLIISAMPNIDSNVRPDRTLVIPGRSGQSQAQDDQQGQARGGQGQAQDEPQGQGRGGQGEAQDEPQGQGRGGQAGTQDEPQGQGRNSQADDNVQSAASGRGGIGALIAAEPDQDFFSGVSSSVQMDAVFNSLSSDVRQGINSVLRSPVGKMLQKPLDAVGDIVLDDPDSEETKNVQVRLNHKSHKNTSKKLDEIRRIARTEGQRVARRLEVLKEEIHKRVRLQSSGAVDRKRFKRAVAGAENVYRQDRSQDITSLAVSIQLDMSGSMGPEISSGKLAGAALALEEALQRLDAEYMVSGFGSDYVLFKSFGDKKIRDGQDAAMMETTLGGTSGAPAMRLGLLGLKETRSANKLHVVMTDGDFFDRGKMIERAAEMRRNGILPFGIFFKKDKYQRPPDSMNQIFGEGGWVEISSLSDLSEVVARRIEQIYRRILATR